MLVRFFQFALIVYICLIPKAILASQPLTLGVLAYLPEEQMLERYQPLADYLKSTLGNRDVRVKALTYANDEVEKAIERNEIDLLLTNPSHFIKLRATHELSGAMLTQVVLRSGEPVSAFGGVIFTHADNLYINTLEDIKGKQIAAADRRSLGGYQAQIYEVLHHGIELKGSTSFLKKHDVVVRAVLDHDADVGFIRSGVIESLIQKGLIDSAKIKILNQKVEPNFPFIRSTALYPEWPLVALPHLSDGEIRRVASALLALDKSHPAARAANIAGFNPPADYQVVDNLARILRVPPYEKSPEFTLSDIWSKHHDGLIAMAISFAIIIALLSLLWQRNHQLRRSAEGLRRAASVFANTSEAISITDVHGAILDVNKAFEEITGYSRAEVIGQNSQVLKSSFQDDAFYTEMWASLVNGHEWHGELWNRHKDGQNYAVQLTIGEIHNDKGEIEGYVSSFFDITQKLFISALEEIRAKAMQSTLEGASLNTTLDKILKDIESLNPKFMCSILLLDKSGQHLMSCSAPSLPDAYNDVINGIEIGDGIGSCGTAAFRQERVIVGDIQQHPYWAEFKELAAQYELGSCWSEPIFGKKGRLLGTFAIYHRTPTIPVARDLDLIARTADFISLLIEEQQAEAELKRLATVDELTALSNRRQLLSTVRTEMKRAARYNTALSFCMIDLDHFKQTNDQYGHDAGDCVLKMVASAMSDFIRTADAVGRLGGEEFGIILPNTTQTDALILAERLRSRIEELTISYRGNLLKVTVSIGVSSIDQGLDVSQGDELLSAADRCLYHAKRNGRNKVSGVPVELYTSG